MAKDRNKQLTSRTRDLNRLKKESGKRAAPPLKRGSNSRIRRISRYR